MRAFFCLELEPALQEKLDRITEMLRKTRVKASWVKKENLHVTLKFLGEIDEALLPKLETGGREALRQSQIPETLEWELDRLGAFPSVERPRVVWVGCSQEPEMIGRLAGQLQEKLQSLGFEPERERFVTHVTLGRVKNGGPTLQTLTQAIRTVQPFKHKARASTLTLMESQLDPQGAIYKPVVRLPFAS